MENELKPIDRKRVYESIVDQMRQLIVDETWKPGQRMPSERELTKALSVGRTSVREALRILEAMGFIEIRAGDGCYVRESVNVPQRLQNLADIFNTDDVNEEYIMELMEARELIESQIAFMAAESATEAEIASLDELIDQQEMILKLSGGGVKENIGFHLRLAEITGNRVLVELQQIFFQLSIGAISRYFMSPGRPEDSVQEHKAIVLAMKAHRPAEAHRLMLEHLRNRYTRLGGVPQA
ncbi:MAG: FadR family transcriptional regulator [Anaerolineales bacterium]|nr:FadR family transcriptional regulator [Anaerolineales bacterium]